MDDKLRKALRYLGTTWGAVMEGLPSGVDDLGLMVRQILINLHEDKVRPSAAQIWQQKMRAEGRCINCGKPTWRPGSSYCGAHREYLRAYRQRKQQEKRLRRTTD